MNGYARIAGCMLVILAALSACQDSQPEPQVRKGTGQPLQVESSAFEAGGSIPIQHTCDGQDMSPPLSWSEPPAGAQSMALIMEDPDAPGGTWDHWVLFNVDATSRSLPEGVPPDQTVEGIGVNGSNSWRRVGYGGPCPPKGSEHRYFFRLYALDTDLNLTPGASRRDLEGAMEGHIIGEGQLMGLYGR